MKECFLGRRVTGNDGALIIKLGNFCRIEMTERCIRRRHQPPVIEAHADIARAAERQPAFKHRLAEARDCLAVLRFRHA